MELACFDEQNYQFELQAYQIVFPNFKYKPLNLVFVEIGTNSKVTPFMVQLATKPFNPLRGGTCLKIIPLHVQIFIIFVLITTIVNQPMEGSERFDKKQDEHINFAYIVMHRQAL